MREGKERLTARASRTSDRVLSLCLLTVAFEGGLLAAGALGLLGADASLAGAAAAGGWDCHDGGLVECVSFLFCMSEFEMVF